MVAHHPKAGEHKPVISYEKDQPLHEVHYASHEIQQIMDPVAQYYYHDLEETARHHDYAHPQHFMDPHPHVEVPHYETAAYASTPYAPHSLEYSERVYPSKHFMAEHDLLDPAATAAAVAAASAPSYMPVETPHHFTPDPLLHMDLNDPHVHFHSYEDFPPDFYKPEFYQEY